MSVSALRDSKGVKRPSSYVSERRNCLPVDPANLNSNLSSDCIDAAKLSLFRDSLKVASLDFDSTNDVSEMARDTRRLLSMNIAAMWEEHQTQFTIRPYGSTSSPNNGLRHGVTTGPRRVGGVQTRQEYALMLLSCKYAGPDASQIIQKDTLKA